MLESYCTEYNLPATFTVNQERLIENIVSLLASFKELKREITASTTAARDFVSAITVFKQYA